MQKILITGSNRGLGLEWVRQYTQKGLRVFATCRNPSNAYELQNIAKIYNNLSIHQLDVTKYDEIDALAKELKPYAIDLLINNAGVYLDKNNISIGSFDYNIWEDTFKTNTLGPIRKKNLLLQFLATWEVLLTFTLWVVTTIDQAKQL